MNMFLPKDKIYIPEINVHGVVVGVYLSIGGTEYRVRYFKDEVSYEIILFDFEIEKPKVENA